QVHLRSQVEHAFGLEAAAQILDDENVAILSKLFPGRRHLLWRILRNAVRSAPKENRERLALIGRRENYRLQFHSIAHWNHDFLQLENRLARGFLRLRGNREQSSKNGNHY